jgi:hypothetical protein
MVVVPAAGVEGGGALPAAVAATEVGIDRVAVAAHSATDRYRVALVGRPACGRVVGDRVMACSAGVVLPAAVHPDGHNVDGGVIVGAPTVRVHIDPVDRDRCRL